MRYVPHVLSRYYFSYSDSECANHFLNNHVLKSILYLQGYLRFGITEQHFLVLFIHSLSLDKTICLISYAKIS